MAALTILVVDDELTVRDYACRALSRSGHVVLPADGGEAALAIAAETAELDVVVSDIVMPGLDGPSLVRALRADRPDLPVVFVSGYTDERLHGLTLDERTRFLPKPFGPAELRTAIEAVVAGG